MESTSPMGATRTARCACGDLRVEATGEPIIVSVCHCLDCQRRSGSPFGAGAFYEKARVRVLGASTPFTRTADSENKATSFFCPRCGSTVYWESEGRPGIVGVAVGAFGDPGFPAPTRSVYEERKHPFVAFDCELTHIP